MQHPHDSSKGVLALADEFSETAKWKGLYEEAAGKLQTLAERLLKIEAENKHLQELLGSALPMLLEVPQKVEKIEPTPEEIICEMQIRILMDSASQRLLTLEETKQLDLFVKNFYVSKEKNNTLTIDAESAKPKSKLPKAELMRIAAQIVDVNDERSSPKK